jgi:hypothetical protein
MSFVIKQNDTSPALLATLRDAAGAAINLTGATIRFHMRRSGRTTVTVDAAATIVTADSGAVRYDWDAADTATAGVFEAEFEVTYSDASIETFPNNKNIPVTITDDIA